MTGDPRALALLQHLQATGFRDVTGARASVTIPLSDPLVNALLAATLPPDAPVREVDIRSQASNRLAVRVRLAKPAFLPPLNLELSIERQPQFPDAPQIVLRMTSLPGLMSLAGAAVSFANVLPPGVRLDRERVIVDIPAQLSRFGHGHLLPYLRRLNVFTEAGRLILDIEARISAPPPTSP